MLKLIILLLVLLPLIVRKTKLHSKSIGKRISKLSIFALVITMFWVSFSAFGPPKYIVHSDSFGKWENKGKPLIVAWEVFRPLPISIFAKPVLLSSNYDHAYEIDASALKIITSNYPYRVPGLGSWMVSLVFFLTLMFFATRNRSIERRWSEAKLEDNVKSYDEFIDWGKSNVFRSLHTLRTRNEAKRQKLITVEKAKAKFELIKTGFQHLGIDSDLVRIFSTLIDGGYKNIGIRIIDMTEHGFPYALDEPVVNVDYMNSPKSEEEYVNIIRNIENKPESELTSLDRNILQTNWSTCFNFPSDKYIAREITEGLLNFLNEKSIRIAGLDLLKFSSNDYLDKSSSEPRLEFSYGFVCGYFSNDQLFGGVAASGIHENNKFRQVNGAESFFYNIPALYIKWNLIIDGVMLDCGSLIAPTEVKFIGDTVSNIKGNSKDEIEKKLFSLNLSANLRNLSSLMMGASLSSVLDRSTLNDFSIVGHSYKNKEQNESKWESLEDALRENIQDEIGGELIRQLYDNNKEIVDQLVNDYIGQVDADSAMVIMNVANEFAPGLIAEILNVTLGQESEE